MDGNTTIAISLIFMIVGGFVGLYGVIAKRDAKTFSAGKENGALQETLNTMKNTLKAIEETNQTFQREHREEHKEINNRLTKVERDFIRFHSNARMEADE